VEYQGEVSIAWKVNYFERKIKAGGLTIPEK
jgi:hypothetical protein